MKRLPLAPTFQIGDIKIGIIESASCFNIGNNFLEDFKSHKKHNQGFGNIYGNQNAFPKTGVLLDDSDFLDMFSGEDRNRPPLPNYIK